MKIPNMKATKTNKCKHVFAQIVHGDNSVMSGSVVLQRFFCTKCLKIICLEVTNEWFSIFSNKELLNEK